ncbi:MAG: hypothetical protein RI922_23 [Bacteroidota bacterium]
MKQFLTFLLLCLSSLSFGQTMKFHVDGNIKNSSLAKPEAGIIVEVIQNGSSVGQTVSASNGKYDLITNVDLTKPFNLVFKKDGFYSKTIAFDYTKVNPEDLPAGDLQPWKNGAIDMYSKSIPADLSFLETEPVAKFGNGADAGPQNGYINSMKTKIDKLLLAAEQKKTADEAKYQAAVAAADALYTQKKYEEALAKYEEANGVKPKEPHPIQRITELDDLIAANKKANLESQLADTEYQNLITAANTLRDQKKYELAIAKYKEALAKRDEQMPKDQIAALEKILADQKKEQENEVKYQEAIKLADMMFNQKTYGKAKEKYTLASQLKPSEQYPKTRLIEIEKKLAEQNVANEKKVKYEEALAAADALFGEQKIEEAKAKYSEALTYEPASTSAEEGVQKCTAILLEKAKEKEKAEKIAKLLTEGGTLLIGNKLPEAKAKYTEVLSLDNANSEATAKLAEIETKLKDAAALAEKEAQFTKLVTEGDAASKALKFADAKSKYEAALAIKADAPTQTKLDGVNSKLTELASAAEKKQKFDQAMLDADALFKESKWEEAKAKYNEAIALDATAALPKDKVKQCDAKLLALSKDKEKADKIIALLAEGNQLFTAEKWNDSKSKYNEVLVLDATNAEAKSQLSEITKKLQEVADKEAQEAKFKKLVAEADAFTTGLKYADAKAKYEEALKLKTDAPTQTKLDGVLAKIAEQEALGAEAAAKKQKFDQAMADADALFKTEKWEDAKAKYNEAIALDATAALPKEKVKACEAKLLELSKDKEKTEKINALLTEANSLFGAEKWNDSKVKYNEVLALDATNAEAKKQLEAIAKKQQEIAAQEANNEKFNKLVAEGDGLSKTQKYSEAIAKYQAAIALKADAGVQSKIDEANVKLKELAEKESVEDQFQRLKAEGMKLAAEQKNQAAKDKLVEAQTLKTDPTVTAKIKELDDKLKAEADALKAEKDYQDILAAAQAKESSNDIDGAIAKYTEALIKRPTDPFPKGKLADLEVLKLNSAKQKEIDAKYNAYLKKGDEFFAKDNFLAAIQEYNLANGLKPEEKEPIEKAALAQQKEEEKGSEDKKNYEKIIVGINKAIGEKDYTRGKELVERAKSYNKQFSIMPNDTRPDDLLRQIQAIELAEKNYTAKMKEAETFASAKDYQKALVAFEQAKIIKPEETTPQNRIDEINEIVNGLMDQQAKEKLYLDHMAKGGVNQAAKSYEQALSHYQNALSVKPGDKVASDKISELQQILDDLANKSKSELDKKNQFEAFITAGDNAFSLTNYQDAIANYKSALQIDNSNLYAKKQIEEAENQIRLSANNAAEIEYQQLITSANEYFNLASYDRAKEKYTEALSKRPTDAYPKTKLAEIDAILNPALVKSTTLQPLGDPYDNSIMDGYAALVKADLERKNLQATEVLTRVEDVVVTQDELMTDKVSDQQETTNEIYLLRNKIAIQEEEGDINRQGTVDVLREEELNRVNETVEADGYEKAENIRAKESIHEAVVSTENENTTRDGVHLENTEKITTITYDQAELIRQQAQADALVNVNADQTIDDVKMSMAENDDNRSEERQKIKEQVKVLQVTNADKTDALTNSKTDQVQSTKKGIDDVKITAGELEKDGAVQTESNENQLKVIEIEVNNGVQNLENKQTESSYELNRGVEEINLYIEENKVERDMNRQETESTLRDESLAIEEKQFEDYSNETVKYLKNKNEINSAVESTVQVDEMAEDKHAIKVEEVKKIDKNIAIVNVESDLTDEQTRQKAKSTIVVANTAAELNSTSSTEKQEKNAYKMSDVSKAKESEQIGQEAKDIDKHYEAQKQLSSVDNTKPAKVIVANTLGQEYPEGVSQESFTQSDENGLMTAIITRRVVVINGQGNVYVRTQTLNSITYTKNGEASTEYVWQKETQSAKLERHF